MALLLDAAKVALTSSLAGMTPVLPRVSVRHGEEPGCCFADLRSCCPELAWLESGNQRRLTKSAVDAGNVSRSFGFHECLDYSTLGVLAVAVAPALLQLPSDFPQASF